MSSSPTAPSSLPEERRLTPRLLLVLCLLSATSPLSIDFYLPSFPEVKESLGTSATLVQLTLTGFLIGLGLGQLGWGPISDHLGRRRPLLVTSVVSALAALVCTLAPTVEVLIAARFVQAVTGAAGIVLARAVIADLFSGFAAARAMSLMMSINAISPIVAPIVGGALAGHMSWRGILGIVVAITVLQVIGVYTTIPETLPLERRTPTVQFGHLGRLLRKPSFLGHTATQWFAFGALMSYISASSFVYQTVIGTSGLVYGLLFAVNAFGLMVAGTASARLAAHRVHPARTVSVALPCLVVAAVVVLAVAVLPVTPWLLVVPLFVAQMSAGFAMTNTAALSIEQARPTTGAGSALMGGGQFLVGGMMSSLGGLADNDTAVPLGITMTACATIAVAAFVLVRRYVATRPHLDAAYATQPATATE